MSCLQAVPVLMLGARFSSRGLLVGVPVAVVLVIATTLGVDPQHVLDNPESLVIPLALVLSTASTRARSWPPTSATGRRARSTS